MKRIKNKQRLDCVALKRQAQAKIYADTKGLSSAEQIDYFRRRATSGVLGAWWEKVSNDTATPLTVHETRGKYSK